MGYHDRPADIDGLSFADDQSSARESLARDLHWKLEILDPSMDGSDWLALMPFQREMYRSAIRYVLLDEEKVRRALTTQGGSDVS